MKIDWDDLFMTMVYLMAMKSKDERTHIGAVVVGSKREIRSSGYNGFVRGLNDSVPERQQRPEKYFWFEHAERNAIYNAALMGISLKDCVMYTNWVPCMDCARAVVQSGIKEVVVDKRWDFGNSLKWKEQNKRAVEMFQETGVKLRYHETNYINIEKLNDGVVLPLNMTEVKECVDKNAEAIKIKKINPDAILPRYAKDGDAGLDLCSAEDYTLRRGEKKIFGTGLQFEIPFGYFGSMRDRSGLAAKYGIHTLAGVIDSGYRGEVGIILVNLGEGDVPIHKGDRISQLIIQPYENCKVIEVSELNETSRGDGGFGSTGR